MYNPTLQLQPGRLLITCINAESVRGRADNPNNSTLTPRLLFQLPTNGDGGTALPIQQSCRIGKIKGYNVTFDNEVVSMDIGDPNQLVIDNEICLIVQLRDGVTGLIGQGSTSISELLLSSSGEAVTRSLSVVKPGDTSTNSKVTVQLSFVKARPGLLKLELSRVSSIFPDNSERRRIVVSTPGQSISSSLSDRSNLEAGFSFFVSEEIWFKELEVSIHDEDSDSDTIVVGEGRVDVLDCLRYDESNKIDSVISISWDKTLNMQTSNISMRHCFLAAGFVMIESISVLGTGTVTNPRVCIKTIKSGVTQMTEAPKSTRDTSVVWEEALFIPVVSESSLLIEFGDLDEVTNHFDVLGKTELDLLPLYKSSRIDATLKLSHQNEVGQIIEHGQVFVFQGPPNVAFPRDQPAVQSHIPGATGDVIVQPPNKRDHGFSDIDIRRAFDKIDLDSNGYIGSAELRHCLVCMGEHVSETEIDMMILISMVMVKFPSGLLKLWWIRLTQQRMTLNIYTFPREDEDPTI
ncbi:hypothetical protein ACHAWC_001995 [Mediolabrus comicus]